MKKIFLIIILVLISVSVMGQNKPISEMDGFEWHRMTIEQKAYFVQGFYAAYVSMWYRAGYEATRAGEIDISKEQGKKLDEYFTFQLKVGEMIDRVNKFYEDYNKREVYIFNVFLYVEGKDYWNKK